MDQAKINHLKKLSNDLKEVLTRACADSEDEEDIMPREEDILDLLDACNELTDAVDEL